MHSFKGFFDPTTDEMPWETDNYVEFRVPVNSYTYLENGLIHFTSTEGGTVQIGDGHPFRVGYGESLVLVKQEGEIVGVILDSTNRVITDICPATLMELTPEEAEEIQKNQYLYRTQMNDMEIPF